MTATGLLTHEWFRYGKRRVYVKTPEGDQVGWVDLVTGQRIVEQESLSDLFHHTIDGHLAAHSQPLTSRDTDLVLTLQATPPETGLAVANAAGRAA